VIDLSRDKYHFLQLLDPVNTAVYLDRHSDNTAKMVLLALAFLAVCAILANLLAMAQGVSRVLSSRIRPRKPSDIRPYTAATD
jgi:hypothetical protein